MTKKIKVLVFVLVIYTLFETMLLIATPPAPHNVKGRVFQSDGSTGVANGIPVTINDTDSGDFVTTRTYAPPIPQFLGSYSATISGSDDDNIIVTAWNSTHYGINTSTLDPTTTDINVVLDTARPSETNVTILIPTNDSLYNISHLFNINANIFIIGGTDPNDCNATITISNESVMNITSTENKTHNLGDLSLGSSTITFWNITTLKEGLSNITVRANCDSDGQNFEKANIKIISNISVIDIFPPNVSLEYPSNNSVFSTLDTVYLVFKYNVSDDSQIDNCSLIINNKMNKTNKTVEKGVSQNISQTLEIGNYNWSINCTDNTSSHNIGSSGIYHLSIIAYTAPVVSNVIVDRAIILNPGTTKRVICNATVTDDDGASNINISNATLYDVNYGSDASDDYNYHYSNNSCTNISSSSSEKNFTCSFDLQYFANNATWACNITAIDINDYSGSETAVTGINELLAFNISPLVIDYGNLNAENYTSPEDINISITNFGNIPINISLEGYGIEQGDNLSMNCYRGNISVDYERYSAFSDLTYEGMTELTNESVQIEEYIIDQRTNDTEYENDKNSTYWKLSLPGNIAGTCNGTVIFGAIDAII